LAFVTTECPISNLYAPVLQRLHAEFRAFAQVHDLAAALRAVLLGKAVEPACTAAVGCTISE
jgi:hypothetical protein